MDVVSCVDAIREGKTRYFTGVPCKHGHIAQRMVSNGSCTKCLNIRSSQYRDQYRKVKAWRKANPEKVAEQARRYAEKHPETNRRAKEKYRAANIDKVRESDRLAQARWRRANPEKQRERIVRFLEKKRAERDSLAGRDKPTECDLCGTSAVGRIVFDHCHKSGLFRGWLCDRCNKVLGLVKDSAELLTKLAEYLKA